MGIIDNVLSRLADKLGATIQGGEHRQGFRDYMDKGRSYSVESEVCETLADLVTMFSAIPISGENERARWLDSIADRVVRGKLRPTVAAAFLTGDCVVVPSWNGRNVQNLVVSSDEFEVLGTCGDEITAMAYVVDRWEERAGEVYTLMQAVELVPYSTESGDAMANRYRMFVSRNGNILPLSGFPHWADRYEEEWHIPNVDRLLIGRMRSHVIDPADLNAVKGAPICFGASEPIREIRHLLDQMHNEFGFSEKAILASKRLFVKEWENGNQVIRLPKGKDRLFMALADSGGEPKIEEWAPDIRYLAYLEAIDKQEKLVERAVGVSSGIISTPNDMNYQNVDNVRKSQQKTMGFVDTARGYAEQCITDLVYAWDVLANYYGITPMGAYEVTFDWSNEYVETFGDLQNAIIAGINVGAMDAVDYRMFVTDESPEEARRRVDEIRAARGASAELDVMEAE